MKRIDLTGRVFGRLVVVEYANRMRGKSFWLCSCVCGSTCVVAVDQLRGSRTKSCGCFRGTHIPFVIHGKARTVEYVAYQSAKQRCDYVKHPGYKNYGGRGIEFRFTSFEQWWAELGPRPTPQHSVDREDNDGHYEPGNVRWATKSEQNNNQRRTHA
jgi:hypothetical protein